VCLRSCSRTDGRSARVSSFLNSRKSLRGSTGVPIGVANTHELPRHSDPAMMRSWP
jgi:hypothetical protein